jgi:hypothetical protein
MPLIIIVFLLPPVQNAPNGTLDIGVGPIPEADRNNTRIDIDIPDQTVDVRVTFRFNQIRKYFICVYLPYTMDWATPYVIHNSVWYPLSSNILKNNPNAPEVGNISRNFMNTANSSIVNATVDLNPAFPAFIFGYPDGKDQLTIGITIKVHESLISMHDTFGSSQTAMFTFFGNNPDEWTDKFYPYTQPLSQPTIGYPFIVDVRLPTSCFYTGSQPAPIEYFVRQEQRWAMFSINFPENNYAQTLVCNFAYPNGQYYKELGVFFIGVLSTLSISFGIRALSLKIEKNKEKDEDHE